MTFVAGAVTAILGAKVNPAGFASYDASMRRAISAAARGESAQARYNTELARSQATMARVGAVARTGLAAGVIGAGVAVAKSVKLAADFEQQLSRLGAVADATGGEMKRLRQQALEQGAATKYSALEAAAAQTELAKGGLKASQILGGGLQAALSLAAAGEMDLAQAAETTVNAMKQFGIDGSKAGHVADALATAANATTVEVSDLAMSLTQGGGVAAMAGASFDETVAAVEALADASIRGSDAGTSLKSFFLNIATASPKAKKAMKELGLSLFDAKGELKSMPAIAGNLRDAFGDLTKEEFLNRAGIIAGTDAARALFAIYKAGPDGMRGYLDGLAKQGTAAEMAAKKQDNLKGKLEQFKGALETAGIALGTTLLPALTDGVERATDVLTNAVESGDFEAFGRDILSGGQTAIEVIRNVADTIATLASTAATAAGPVVHVADALGLFTPEGITAVVTAFAGFKVASTVAPMVAALVTQVRLLSTAPSLGALGADLLAMVNPVTAIATLAAVAAAGIYLMARSNNEAAEAAKKHAEGLREVADAMEALDKSELSEAEAKHGYKQALLDRKNAKQDLADTRQRRKEGTATLRELEAAELRYEGTVLAAESARRRANDATADRKKKASDQFIKAMEKESEAQARVDKAREGVKDAGYTGNDEAKAQARKELADAERQYSENVKKTADANAKLLVSGENVERLLNKQKQVTTENAAGYLKLQNAIKDLPEDKRTKILLEGDQAALARMGELSAQARKKDKKLVQAIISGDEPVKVKLAALTALAKKKDAKTIKALVEGDQPAQVKIAALSALARGVEPAVVKSAVAGDGPAKGKLARLAEAVNNVPPEKTVHVRAAVDWGGLNTFLNAVDRANAGGKRTPKKRAAGRAPGTGELALVGEGRNPREAIVDPKTGRAIVTDGPMVMALPDSAYVIPEDPAYRGRAMSLLAMLAGDLGLKGFAKGKAAKKRTSSALGGAALGKFVPGDLTPTRLPLSDIEKREGDARQKLGSTKDKVKQAQSDISEVRKRAAKSDKERAEKSKDLTRARAKLAELKARESRERSVWQKEQAMLAAAKRWQAKITALETKADTEAARMANANRTGDAAGYESARRTRVGLLEQLRAMIGAARDAYSGQAKLDAEKRFEELTGEIQDAQAPAADDAMSAAERTALAGLDKNVALAALTSGLEDDKSAAAAKEQFLSGLLNQALSVGRSDSVITELADAVASARSNLQSLTGNGSNDNADLQAQIDQQRARADREAENNRINAAALSAFTGSGDVGFGRNVTVNFPSVVPYSPEQAQRVAGIAASGFGYQRPVGSPRLSVG